MQIPIIDLAAWITSTDPSARLFAAQELVLACHTTGFVYLKNYGISHSRVAEAFTWSKKFYALPESQKAQASHPPDSQIFRGYSKLGHETVQPIDGEKIEGVPDFTESYGIGSDENPDQPNVWIEEDALPGFRGFALGFHRECYQASQVVLRALAVGLGLDEMDLVKCHSDFGNELSYRHYPPIGEGKVRRGEVDRLGAHTDFDSLTLLWQDELGGLTVKHPRTGKWIDAPPIEDTLIMNIGDALSRWSNDYLTSTMHRVHLPSRDKSFTVIDGDRVTKPRFSIPYFVTPNEAVVMKRLDIPVIA